MTSSYHRKNFCRSTRKARIAKLSQYLQQNVPQDVSLVFCGISGMSIGIPVADATGRDFAIIRKQDEDSHGDPIEGNIAEKFIIIDDMIDSGATMHYILSKCDEKCVGILLYHGWCDSSSQYGGIPVRNFDQSCGVSEI